MITNPDQAIVGCLIDHLLTGQGILQEPDSVLNELSVIHKTGGVSSPLRSIYKSIFSKNPSTRKMSLLDQPEEIIIEQVRSLPLSDLLSICSTNSQISKICQGKRLWYLRLIDDFKVTLPSYHPNPREYYFSLLRGRAAILNFILNDITEEYFDENAGFFNELEMWTYQEFINTQTSQIDRLTGSEIETLVGLIKLVPRATIVRPEIMGPDSLNSFYFDPYGTILFTSTEKY